MNRNLIRWIIVISSFIIISLILWNTYNFFQHFKSEERKKMENWTFAYEEFSKNIYDPDTEINIVADFIVTDTTVTTPMLLMDQENNIISFRNIDSTEVESLRDIEQLKRQLSDENTPLKLTFSETDTGTLYYGNSPLLNKLKYYPLALMLIIFLFGAVVFFFYRSSKNAAQNKLWTGMAKETAHQIGTPLSSLVGWTEILKAENVNPEYLVEIEKDITRLQTITERFSKIGSVPTMEKVDVVKETIEAFEYLKARSSKLIDFEIEAPQKVIMADLNPQLYGWTIENLVKNAIDAMKGKGKLKIKIFETDKYVKINIVDSGKGIHKHQFHKIFEPGYTSKKRGWGLGLSLAKRIIEDYHKGRIKVLSSEINKGTTMQIALRNLT
ncbi:MAG: HAMP domain-containing sensor histidine kinase [Flavobacteriaceae bacterium]|nr:HAMP domain-containing sensor histidine kinase [Flavobacteriaceae bacterium]